jgi:5-methylcytosine-specific restriction endonuclease McrA
MAKWPYTTQRWQRLRKQKLQANPLCEMCLKQGGIEVATVVDHIVGINKGGQAFPPLDGLMSCCESCHNRKTRIVEQLDKDLTPKVIRGCDVDGRPFDQ